MKNSWKGLVVGGMTGALVGIVIDVATKAIEEAVLGAESARERAPEAAEWLASMTHKATEWAAETDVPERVRHISQQLGDSDLASKAGAAATKVAGTTLQKVRSSIGRAS